MKLRKKFAQTSERIWYCLCLQPDGSQNGTLELSIKMKFNYVPPTVSMRTATQMAREGRDLEKDMSLLPGEAAELQQRDLG